MAVLTAASLAQSSSNPPASPRGIQEPVTLKLGKPVERELRGGESNSYKIHVEARQFLHVVVMQEAILVALTLLDPAGKEVAMMSNVAYGPEPVSAIADAAGDFRLKVTMLSKDPAVGRYQAQLTDLREPVPSDPTRIEAEENYTEGVELLGRRDAESFKAAAGKWHQSFILWQSLDDKSGQALSLFTAGAAYSVLGEKEKALDNYFQALPLLRAVGNHAGEAITLGKIGLVYYDLGESENALIYDFQALPLLRAVGNHAGEAATLNNIGRIYDDLGEKQKALDYYAQAIPLFRAVNDRADEAATLTNIGTVYSDLGKKQKALDCYLQALPLFRAAGKPAGEATTLNDIGLVYFDLGEKEKALKYYFQALPLFPTVGSQAAKVSTLNNIGAVTTISRRNRRRWTITSKRWRC